MLSVYSPRPTPGKVPLQGFRLPNAVEGITLNVFDELDYA
jgi:hypothetical protein